MSAAQTMRGREPGMKSGVPIRIARVSKTFGEDGDTPFLALREIDMDIAPGEFISVVGPSGCGKSTLMLMVAGLLRRSRGDIVVDGRSVTKPITDVGIAFQDHLLLDFRSAIDNVMLQADIRGLPRKKIDARARELFEQLRLTHAIDKYPRQLSGGMRQRVSLVRTLVHDPSVILMDEPFGALDAMTRQGLQDEVLSIVRDTGATAFFVTHDLEEAIYLGDRVIGMLPHPGRVEIEVAVKLPHPRNQLTTREDPEFLRLRRQLFDFIKDAES